PRPARPQSPVVLSYAGLVFRPARPSRARASRFRPHPATGRPVPRQGPQLGRCQRANRTQGRAAGRSRPRGVSRKIGPQILDLAYRAARDADPPARLVVNEYDVELDAPEHEARRVALLRLLERMRGSGTPPPAARAQ